MAPGCLQSSAPPSVSAKRQEPHPISPRQSHVCPFIHQTLHTHFLTPISNGTAPLGCLRPFPEGTNLCSCDFSSSSSSSSSPLLSLVQVPAKLAINLSIHTQHTYDNGVDRTGDRVFRKYSFLHEEREEEKIFLTPRLCSIWSTVWEQKKKHLSTKAHIP